MVNFIAFQIVWFSCVLGASWGYGWLPPLATVVFVAMHFSMSQVRRSDFQVLVLAMCIGICLATLWSLLGILQYASQPLPPLPPLWIICLWAAFALTLNHSLVWMQRNLYLAALLAAIGSPLSYYGAQKLGAVVWVDSFAVIAATAISWSLVVPLLLKKAARWREEGDHAMA